jgi:type VI secretion system protein
MALRLSILSGDVAGSGNRSRKTFSVNGGRIGRAPDNDWVLVDPERFVSSHHAEIEHRAGEWWLCDTSTNGTFVNGSSRPLGRGGKQRLADGDRIRIGSMELVVEITGGNDFMLDDDAALSDTSLDRSFEVKSLLSSDTGEVRPADAYGQPLPANSKAPGKPRRKASSARTSPASRTGGPDAESPQLQAVAERPATAVETKKPVERDLWPGLQAFCQGAGIDPYSLPAGRRNEVLHEAGQVLRETMLGLMELARARAEFTHEVGISGNRKQRDATSPMMQVRAVEEALADLLTGTDADGNHAVNEIRRQFAKTLHHQQSMLVALRAALSAALDNLDPDQLEQRFGGTTRGPASADALARYWGLYRETFKSFATTRETGLPAAFEEEFARAYQALVTAGLGPTSTPGETF